MTDEEELALVQEAIRAILTKNQSYSFGNRMMTRANLKELYERERELRLRISRRRGISVYGATPIDG